MFRVQELGSPEPITMLINPQEEDMPEMPTKIDTLNSYLLNGYFLNCLSILTELDRSDLIDSIMKEHEILFPENYRGGRAFFNSYFDNVSMTLIKMPYVHGLDQFIESINQSTKKEPKTLQGFTVYAKLSPDNELIDYVVLPSRFTELFDQNSSLLSFSNQNRTTSKLVLKFNRSRNGKKYSALNERALTDQNSPDFKTKYPSPSRAIN
jgi:hypothetical protein